MKYANTTRYKTFSTKELDQLEELLEREVFSLSKLRQAGRDIEPIDVIEDWQLPHHLGCALKYIARAGRKQNEGEDLLKAIWYLKRRLDILNLQ